MRDPRLKVRPENGEGCYHLMSRTVNGEFLFGEVEKEMLRKHIWRVAEYCGIQVITAAPMSNHFHITVRVPAPAPVSDAELLRRYALLHSGISRWEVQPLEAIEHMLAENGEDAEAWRQRQLAMMRDISPYMQLVKQRFSIWFNRTHNRYGTLWASRYKSVMLDPKSDAVLRSALYTDLNPVKAGMVTDPKDYRFCGYAQALAGDPVARAGLCSIFPGENWEQVQKVYRTILFSRAAQFRAKGAAIPQELAEQVIALGGKIPVGELMCFKAKYFADGAVLGSKAFVAEQLAEYRRRTGRGERTVVREVAEIGGLAIMHKVRRLVAEPT